MKNFQIIMIVVFIVAAIFGLLVFSGAIPLGTSNAPGKGGTVVLWGTVPSGGIAKALTEFNKANPSFTVKYEEKSQDTFDQDLLEALATGKGPDMFFLSDDLAFHYSNKIYTIPYASYPLSSFKNTFAGAGEVFLTSKGTLAFPLSVDPLMMYYNRSILDSEAIANPPATWDDMATMLPLLVKKDDTNKIIKPAIAFGHFSNITHAKDILAALFMQAGNPIVDAKNGGFSSTLGSSVGSYNLPSILKFYTDFADPSSPSYSWNRSFPNSTDAFSANNLAFYFGYGSEIDSLVKKNPNQDFFVAGIPQIKNALSKTTGAHVTGIAILSSSKNFATAFTASSLLATSDFALKFATALNMAPARRNLLATKPTDNAYSPIFYSSALYAKSWIDPSSKGTDTIFSGMINGVLSGNMTVSEAIKDANSKMSLLLR